MAWVPRSASAWRADRYSGGTPGGGEDDVVIVIEAEVPGAGVDRFAVRAGSRSRRR